MLANFKLKNYEIPSLFTVYCKGNWKGTNIHKINDNKILLLLAGTSKLVNLRGKIRGYKGLRGVNNSVPPPWTFMLIGPVNSILYLHVLFYNFFFRTFNPIRA